MKSAGGGAAGSGNMGYSGDLPRDDRSSLPSRSSPTPVVTSSKAGDDSNGRIPMGEGDPRGDALPKGAEGGKAGGAGVGGGVGAGGGGVDSSDSLEDAQSELATVNRLVYSDENLEAAMAIAHATAPAKAPRGRQLDNPIKPVSRRERGSRKAASRRSTPSGRSSGVTVAGASGAAKIFASEGNGNSGVRRAIKSQAGAGGRRPLEMPPMPRSFFGVLGSSSRPGLDSKTGRGKGAEYKRVGPAERRVKRITSSEQEPDGFLPPEMKPLARAVREQDVPTSKSQEWSSRRSRGSNASNSGGGGNLRSAPGGSLPPGVLPPGVKLPGVSLPRKPAKLGGKDEYAFLAAGDE